MASSPSPRSFGLDRQSSEPETSVDILASSPITIGRNNKRKAEVAEQDLAHMTKRHMSESHRMNLKVPGLVWPKSKYFGTQPPLPVVPEQLAIKELHVNLLIL